MTDAILEIIDAGKRYGGFQALADATMTMRAGEVRALLGKNGAGKSTLIKIISGAIRPDSGTVRIAGTAMSFANEAAAIAAGVVTVYQELSIVGTMTAAENIALGRWPRVGGSKAGPIDHARMVADARAALASLGEDLPVDVPMAELTLAQQQMTEIARALSLEPRVMLLDEPFSALSLQEVDNLIARVRAIAARGIAVVFVSHRMKEVSGLAETFTILRDGRIVAEGRLADHAMSEIAELIVGQAAAQRAPAAAMPSADVPVRLAVDGLAIPERGLVASLAVREGEIVGLAGLLGAGRSEILRALAGIDPRRFARLTIDGVPVERWSFDAALDRGIYMVPENRQVEGLIPVFSVEENIALPSIALNGAGLRLDWRALAAAAQRIIQSLAIKVDNQRDLIGSLSGGNQQKVVIGKWLARGGVRVLLLDEPSRGVDVGAREQIHELIRTMARSGVACLVVSSEVEELLALCHRILLVGDGGIVADIPAATTSESELTAMMLRGSSARAAA